MRRYWESWAKDVAVIAERHTDRIRALLASGETRHKQAFAAFLAGLRDNINPSITEDDAIEMLSQHVITRPVFDALFENYAFTQHNPVSQAMQTMLDTLHDQALEKETVALEKFRCFSGTFRTVVVRISKLRSISRAISAQGMTRTHTADSSIASGRPSTIWQIRAIAVLSAACGV